MEAVLLEHPGVLDAAVIGVPHAITGEIPKAFIVRKDENVKETDIVDFLQGFYNVSTLK